MTAYAIWLVNEEPVRQRNDRIERWLGSDAARLAVLERDVVKTRRSLWSTPDGNSWAMEPEGGGQQELELTLSQPNEANPRTILSYWLGPPPEPGRAFDTMRGMSFCFELLPAGSLHGSAMVHASHFVRRICHSATTGSGVAVEIPATAARRAHLFVLPLVRDEKDIEDVLRRPREEGWIFTRPFRNAAFSDNKSSFFAEDWSTLRRQWFDRLKKQGPALHEWPPILRLCATADLAGFRDWLEEGGCLAVAGDQEALCVLYPAANAMARARAESWPPPSVPEADGASGWREQVRAAEREWLTAEASRWGWERVTVAELPEAEAREWMGADLVPWDAESDIRNSWPLVAVAEEAMPPVALADGGARPLFPFLQHHLADLPSPSSASVLRDLMHWDDGATTHLRERWSRWELGLRLFLPGLQSFRYSSSGDPDQEPEQGLLANLAGFLMHWMVAAARDQADHAAWMEHPQSDMMQRLAAVLECKGEWETEVFEGQWRIRLLTEVNRARLEQILPRHRIAPNHFVLDESRLDFDRLG